MSVTPVQPVHPEPPGAVPPGPVDPLRFRGPGDALSDPLAILTYLRREYGDVVRYRHPRAAGSEGIVTLVSDPALVQEVFKSPHYVRTPERSSFFGKSMLGLSGPPWERRRRSLLPLFSRSRIESLVEVFRRGTASMVDGWPAGGGAVADFVRQLDLLALSGAGECLYGVPIQERVADAIQTLLREIALIDAGLFGLPVTLGTDRMRRFAAASQEIAAFAERVTHSDTAEWRAMRTGVQASLVDGTSAAAAARDLRDEVVALLLAASETTSTSLGWVWAMLLLHPRWSEAVTAEVDAVLGQRPITAADVPRLPVLQRVIHETLRLYPAIWQTPRTVLRDVHLGGFLIPAQTTVMISPYVVQRHERHWADPDGFDPDRFTDPAMVDHPAYVPFISGRHTCIGKQFALLTMTTIVATVAQRSRLGLTDAAFQPVIEPLSTLRMRDGLPVVHARRAGVAAT